MAKCIFINNDALEQSGARAKKGVNEISASSHSYFKNHKAFLVVRIIIIIMPIWISTITNDLKLHKTTNQTVKLVHTM
jgi:hypothetical protein